MAFIGVPFTSFDLEGNSKSGLVLSISHGDLYRSIYITLKPIHRGPDVLLGLEKFVDTQVRFRAVPVFYDCFVLDSVSIEICSSTSALPTEGFEATKTSAQAFNSGILLIK